MKRFLKPKAVIHYWLPPIVWGAVIFSFSSFPTPKTSEIYWQDFLVKKTAHLIEYGILACLLYRAFRNNGLTNTKAGVLAIIVVFFYGATDEFHQRFTPGREPRIRDVLIDTGSSVLVILAILNWLPKAPEKVKDWARKIEML